MAMLFILMCLSWKGGRERSDQHDSGRKDRANAHLLEHQYGRKQGENEGYVQMSYCLAAVRKKRRGKISDGEGAAVRTPRYGRRRGKERGGRIKTLFLFLQKKRKRLIARSTHVVSSFALDMVTRREGEGGGGGGGRARGGRGRGKTIYCDL